ncbi:uncharacterized protein LOC114334514 [Diabrotica virgifera virgifera]|uniref:Uncharacterized protein LOC114334514 n=1 Tax=Diabrotica virgifera virgifera TaxID=50390 RepID=A0A6P7G002_DIAVI|nr:uncharacterized protein LOC114334514 [Diabrotica virgifera virgifera]
MRLWSAMFFFVVLFSVLQCLFALPVGKPENALEVMSQVPQWHCMRYRKFELVRRCRSYKNSIRRS